MKGKVLYHLERHSLLLILASFIGHVGNYTFHTITGRMLPEEEYGLMMALFGAVYVVLFPLSALQVSLSRTIAEYTALNNRSAISGLIRFWTLRLCRVSLVILGIVGITHPLLFSLFGLRRWPPLVLTALIPCLALFLTLTGAGLHGLQNFKGLALRGSLLFVSRALLVGGCLVFRFAAAGWAMLAHVLGMLLSLGVSIWMLRSCLTTTAPPPPDASVLEGTLKAFPLLFAFSMMMSADVVLVRAFHSEELSGAFAQAATLGRMILWIPLPIAQAIFPKVVGDVAGGEPHQSLLFKALLYTLVLVAGALAGAWILGAFLFELVFGIAPTSDQIGWLRGIGICMSFLGPVYVILHYEIAQRRHAAMVPICFFAVVYVGSAWVLTPTPDQLIQFLGVATLFSLFTAVRGLGPGPASPSAPSLSEAE